MSELTIKYIILAKTFKDKLRNKYVKWTWLRTLYEKEERPFFINSWRWISLLSWNLSNWHFKHKLLTSNNSFELCMIKAHSIRKVGNSLYNASDTFGGIFLTFKKQQKTIRNPCINFCLFLNVKHNDGIHYIKKNFKASYSKIFSTFFIKRLWLYETM